MSNIDIKLLGFRDDNSFDQNFINLGFSGNSVNHVIINSLRRILLDEIPCSAFSIDNINIIENTSVYNNDYMRNRIEQFPLIGIDKKLDLEEYEKIKNNTLNDDEENNLISIYCNVENLTDEIMSVTSDELEFYMNDKKINSIYKNPVLFCKLKPGEKLNFSAKSNVGLALDHAKYSAVGLCSFEEDNNKFNFKVEPRGQIKSKELLTRALKILSFKLETLKTKINKIKFTSENQGKIMLNNEDHTLGNLISRGLQDHKNIEFAGYKLEHLLIRDLIIDYVTDGGKGINEILNDVILNYLKIFDNMTKEIDKLKFT